MLHFDVISIMIALMRTHGLMLGSLLGFIRVKRVHSKELCCCFGRLGSSWGWVLWSFFMLSGATDLSWPTKAARTLRTCARHASLLAPTHDKINTWLWGECSGMS